MSSAYESPITRPMASGPQHLPDLADLPKLPEGFLWGVATSAHQTEGGIEGNDWHVFTTSEAITRRVRRLARLAGLAIELQPAGEAVRHRDLDVLKEDLDRAKLLGMNAYRFSIEWSRVEQAPGVRNEEALRYYSNAIDAMLQRGLKPVVTLNHLTLPQWSLTPPKKSGLFSTIGARETDADPDFNASLRGWENEATVAAFQHFVTVVTKEFMDRVDTWITLTEPAGSMIGVGYLGGIWPPGFLLAGRRAKAAYFNLLRAHVQAYLTIKGLYQNRPSYVGVAHNMTYVKPAEIPGSAIYKGAALGASIATAVGRVAALRRRTLARALIGGTVGAVSTALLMGRLNEKARKQFAYFYNYHFLDALIDGSVDVAIDWREGKQHRVDARDFFGLPNDRPWRPMIDFIGLNYYRSAYVYFHPAVALRAGFTGGAFDFDLHRSKQKHNLLSRLGWEVSPEGLYFSLKNLHARYKNADGSPMPIYITEDGIAEESDSNRAPFIVAYLQQMLLALRDGVDVRGYFHWTLLDNYEWAEGYNPRARFGLFTVDRDARDAKGNRTLPRLMTEGALALQYIIAETASPLDLADDEAERQVLKVNGLGQATARFGYISPEGRIVVPPCKSAGAVWRGTIEEEGRLTQFSLYLSPLSPLKANGRQLDRWLGMIFPARLNRWIRLRNVSWLPGPADIDTLEFCHPFEARGEGEIRIYRATVNRATGRLNGTVNCGNALMPWCAEKFPHWGVWQSQEYPYFISLREIYGASGMGTAKALGRLTGQAWIPLDTVSEGKVLRMNGGDITSLVGEVRGAIFRGKITFQTARDPVMWEATRLLDDLSF